MGKMKFKAGDRVRIKSVDWYNKNKDKHGIVICGMMPFCGYMSCRCGTIVTISEILEWGYCIEEDCGENGWTDEMIECKVEEETKPKFKVGDIVYSTTWQRDVIIQEILPDGLYKVGDLQGLGWFKENEDNLLKEKITLPTDFHLTKPLKHEISLPEEHQFVDENGNVINTTKIVLEKKKKEYPKTFRECQKYLGEDVPPMEEPVSKTHRRRQVHLLEVLLICRDAYWKIAGEEIGLEKPWEPDWDNLSINREYIKINKGCFTYSSRVLIFPTEEMRDAFYENFKELIESCKELL